MTAAAVVAAAMVLASAYTASAQAPNTNAAMSPSAASAVTPKPLYQLEYERNLDATVKSIAVVDMHGNHQPSLIYLSSLPDHPNETKLVIAHWNGTSFVSDKSKVINARPDILEVGKFAGNTGPWVIATSDGVRYLEDGVLKSKPFPQPEDIVGKLTDLSGATRLAIATPQMKIVTVGINLTAGATTLTDPQPMPPSSAIASMDLRSLPSSLESIGLPSALVKGGIMGLVRANAASRLLLYYLVASHEENAQGQTTGSSHWSVMFVNPAAVVPKSLYTTPVLTGSILCLAHRSPVSPYSNGLLVLTSASRKGPGTGLYFFKLARK